MNNLPVLTPRRLIGALSRAGFVLHHVRGSHHYYRHPDRPGILLTVPFHNRDLKRGTLRAILRQAGLTIDDLDRLL
ncbi:MAG TPA: type II toxin-antitoxin system HicA family toxin [Stellaceae bacterium]|nr:type II toxin-antitoxin system HicA family toxin [Stellaceae bacterium]